ncbi:hypothetical protein N9L68_06330 [bacterium]|nr:hypothetical protein [bacterium]
MHYCGFCEDTTELDWVPEFMTNDLTDRITDGTIVPSGLRLQSEEIPADVLEAPAAPPAMNVCVRGRGHKKRLQIPEHWFNNLAGGNSTSRIAQEFLGEIHEELGVALPDATLAPARDYDHAPGPSPRQRPRIQKSKAIPVRQGQLVTTYEQTQTRSHVVR